MFFMLGEKVWLVCDSEIADENAMSAESGTTPNHRLFCYGSLRVVEVIRAVIGRAPECRPAELRDHALRRIRNATYPGVTHLAGARTPGCVYEGLSPDELQKLDEFEGEPYARELRTIQLENGAGTEAWVYLLPDNRRDWLTDAPWELEAFRLNDLEEFLHRCFGVKDD